MRVPGKYSKLAAQVWDMCQLVAASSAITGILWFAYYIRTH